MQSFHFSNSFGAVLLRPLNFYAVPGRSDFVCVYSIIKYNRTCLFLLKSNSYRIVHFKHCAMSIFTDFVWKRVWPNLIYLRDCSNFIVSYKCFALTECGMVVLKCHNIFKPHTPLLNLITMCFHWLEWNYLVVLVI